MASDGHGPHSRRFVKRPNVTRHVRDNEGRLRGLYLQTDNTLEKIAWALDVWCPRCHRGPGNACASLTRGVLIHPERMKEGREFNRPPK